jgi:hypothetical protein
VRRKVAIERELFWKGENSRMLAYKIREKVISIDYLDCLLSA